MAQGIKLTDSVSISELMHMRDVEGLSNAQIAKSWIATSARSTT